MASTPGVSEQALRVRVGRNVRRRMIEQGLSLQQLADLAGVNLGHLSRALNGRQSMTLDRLAKLADVLKLDPVDLLAPERSSDLPG